MSMPEEAVGVAAMCRSTLQDCCPMMDTLVCVTVEAHLGLLRLVRRQISVLIEVSE